MCTTAACRSHRSLGHRIEPETKKLSFLDLYFAANLSKHILDGLPGDSPLGVEVVEVVHHELVARSEVGPVELVGDVPAQRTKLPPLLESTKLLFSELEIDLPSLGSVWLQKHSDDKVGRLFAVVGQMSEQCQQSGRLTFNFRTCTNNISALEFK